MKTDLDSRDFSIICLKCGEENSTENKYCSSCGSDLSKYSDKRKWQAEIEEILEKDE